MSEYQFSVENYRSPQRLRDPESGQFIDKWKTVEDFTLTTPDGLQLFIPKGFKYDKASVPRAVWWYIPRDHKQTVIAALVHDFLYEYRLLSRKQSDQIFYDLLRLAGMRYTKAKMAYWAVRAGGWVYWNREE